MNALSGALCRGRWWLFDSTDYRDHLVAAELCAACPVIESCHELLQSIVGANAAASTAHYGVHGTWAGLLFGRQGMPRPRVDERPNRTSERVEFGVESGPASAATDRGLPITQLRT